MKLVHHSLKASPYNRWIRTSEWFYFRDNIIWFWKLYSLNFGANGHRHPKWANEQQILRLFSVDCNHDDFQCQILTLRSFQAVHFTIHHFSSIMFWKFYFWISVTRFSSRKRSARNTCLVSLVTETYFQSMFDKTQYIPTSPATQAFSV